MTRNKYLLSDDAYIRHLSESLPEGSQHPSLTTYKPPLLSGPTNHFEGDGNELFCTFTFQVIEALFFFFGMEEVPCQIMGQVIIMLRGSIEPN